MNNKNDNRYILPIESMPLIIALIAVVNAIVILHPHVDEIADAVRSERAVSVGEIQDEDGADQLALRSDGSDRRDGR